jgi:hypothetical protein
MEIFSVNTADKQKFDHIPSCSSAGLRHVFPQPTSQHFAFPEQSLSLKHFKGQVSDGFTVGHRPGLTCLLFTKRYKRRYQVSSKFDNGRTP